MPTKPQMTIPLDLQPFCTIRIGNQSSLLKNPLLFHCYLDLLRLWYHDFWSSLSETYQKKEDYVHACMHVFMAYCSLRKEMGRNEMEMEICSLRNGNL